MEAFPFLKSRHISQSRKNCFEFSANTKSAQLPFSLFMYQQIRSVKFKHCTTRHCTITLFPKLFCKEARPLLLSPWLLVANQHLLCAASGASHGNDFVSMAGF